MDAPFFNEVFQIELDRMSISRRLASNGKERGTEKTEIPGYLLLSYNSIEISHCQANFLHTTFTSLTLTIHRFVILIEYHKLKLAATQHIKPNKQGVKNVKKVLIIVAAVTLVVGAIGAGFSLAQAAPLPAAQGNALGQFSSAVKNVVTALGTATGSPVTNQDGDGVVHGYL